MPPRIRAGALRDRVRFELFALAAPNELGEQTSTWSSFATRSAQIEPLSGREFFAAKQTTSEVTTRIRCRWFAGVTTSMRIVKLPAETPGNPTVDRVFDIDSIINVDERDRELELFCREAVA